MFMGMSTCPFPTFTFQCLKFSLMLAGGIRLAIVYATDLLSLTVSTFIWSKCYASTLGLHEW